MSKIKFLYALPIVLAVSSGVTLDLTSSDSGGSLVSTNLEAYAKSRGGRSSGGSFRRSSPRRSSPRRTSTGSGTRSNRGGGGYYHSSPSYGGRTYVYVYPLWAQILFLTLLLLMLLVLFLAIAQLLKQWGEKGSDGVPKELANDIVTVNKLQVALLGNAKEVQSEISELIRNADLSSSEGLAEQLQEATLVLLRNSASWTHVCSSSQKVKTREKAEMIFKELSIAERSKFSSETLSNVNGHIKEREAVSPESDETADYIVVTLLVGTEDDKPLFAEVNTFAELESSLKRIAATPPDYLLTFELLIGPQEESDCLTYDDLLTEYQEMRQLV